MGCSERAGAAVRRALASFLVVLSLGAQPSRPKEAQAQIPAPQGQGQFAEAARRAKEGVAAVERALGNDSPQFALYLDEVATLLKAQGDYRGAESYGARALEIMERALGKADPNVAAVKNNLAEIYRSEGRYRSAEPLLLEAIQVLKPIPARAVDYAISLNNLGLVYQAQARYEEAVSLYDESIELLSRSLGPGDPAVANAISDLGMVRRDQGRSAEAAALYRRAIAVYTNAGAGDTPEIAAVFSNLGAVLSDQGKYADAEQSYRRALAIDEKTSGANHPDVATDLNNLAALAHARHDFGEAERIYRRALAIDEAVSPEPNPAVARDLNNLSNVYQDQGKYAEAGQLSKRAVDIAMNTLGGHHPDVANILNSAAALCEHLGAESSPCEPLYQRALAINEEVFGKSHPAVASNLNNLGSIYFGSHKDAEAESLFRRAIDILAAADRKGPLLVWSTANLAMVYQDQGKYSEAEELFRKALDVGDSSLGKEDYGLAQVRHNLATLYYAQGKSAEAGAVWERSLSALRSQFESQFGYMSERDRLSFFATTAGVFPIFLSFCYSNREKAPEFAGKMYDFALWRKGLVASGITAVRSEIAASGDREALAMFEELAAQRGELAKLQNRRDAPPASWKDTVERLREQSNALETALVQRFRAAGQNRTLARATWQDVANSLKPGEAAVEFIRFPFHDGRDWTKKSYYIALVITPPGDRPPVLVTLGDGDELERGPLADYRDCVGTRQPDTGSGMRFYEAFWKPLEGALAGARKVFVSPDGALQQVSWAAVPADGGRLLTEKYDVEVLLSTKDVLKAKPAASARTAVLIGNPAFDLSAPDQRAAVAVLRSSRARKGSDETPEGITSAGPGSSVRSRDGSGGRLKPLRETETEVAEIQRLLEKEGWQVEAFVREAALEEAVKQVRQPRTLHIATHGFFEADAKSPGIHSRDAEKRLEDPLLRSGLYLAGANRVRSSAEPEAGLEDGVLTAYEITGLHLQGTELVVLSACETGLGVVSNGEGVFGLRRALQEAGAEAVLMSMWSVPDEQTQRLMALFYKNWLSGNDKQNALRVAQQTLRKELLERWGEAPPYYWAAFVLVGQ